MDFVIHLKHRKDKILLYLCPSQNFENWGENYCSLKNYRGRFGFDSKSSWTVSTSSDGIYLVKLLFHFLIGDNNFALAA